MSKKLKTAIYIGASVAALVLVAAAAAGLDPVHAAIGSLLALVVPPAIAARNSGEQQTHYFRYRMQVNQVAGLSGGVKIGRLPSRAFITGIAIHVNTIFNSATTDAIQIGSTNGGTDILASSGGNLKTAGYTLTTAAGLGIVVGTTGETDLWVKYSQSGAAATAGDATLVITYIPDGDQ